MNWAVYCEKEVESLPSSPSYYSIPTRSFSGNDLYLMVLLGDGGRIRKREAELAANDVDELAYRRSVSTASLLHSDTTNIIIQQCCISSTMILFKIE